MEEKNFGPIRFIPGKRNGRYPSCHSVLIEGDGIIIDPASDRERLGSLRDNPGVKAVWLSHWHEDHIMHLDLFDDLPIWISESDAPPISDMNFFLEEVETDDPDVLQYWKTILVEKFHYRPRKPAGFLKGGDIIRLEDVSVEIIHTPGHTSGHLCFFFVEPKVLFLGDYDLTPFGPWYGDQGSNIDDVISSVNRLRQIPARVWLTSHETGIFEEAPEKLWDAFLEVIQTREEKLLALLHQPKTMEDIVQACIVYGRPREPRAFFELGERAIMKKHLQRLMHKSMVVEEDNRYVLSGAPQ